MLFRSFTKSAIQIYIIKHNAIVRLASSELDGRNHALSNCALNVVNLSKYLDKHGYLGPTYLNPVKVEESLKEVLANQTNFIKEFIWEVKK